MSQIIEGSIIEMKATATTYNITRPGTEWLVYTVVGQHVYLGPRDAKKFEKHKGMRLTNVQQNARSIYRVPVSDVRATGEIYPPCHNNQAALQFLRHD